MFSANASEGNRRLSGGLIHIEIEGGVPSGPEHILQSFQLMKENCLLPDRNSTLKML